VGGEVLIEMSPEALERHNKVKTAVTAAVAAFVDQRDSGEVYSDRTLVTHEAASLSVEPDLTFVSWASFERGRVRLVGKAGAPQPQGEGGPAGDFVELVGSPDLVVEIVSDSSVRKDRILLRDAYGRAGVGEYWLIDARGQEIQFEILRNHDGVMISPPDAFAPQVSHVLEGTWTLTRSTNRAGRFTYRLTHADR
jgi:Uma2 family endonuclease